MQPVAKRKMILTSMRTKIRTVLFRAVVAMSFLVTLSVSPAAEPVAGRERLLLDFGWKFHLGNEWGLANSLAKAGTGSGPASTSFSDRSWRTVNLPHDWAIELPFDKDSDGSHGFKALGVGFESNSIAWYRRTFDLPKTDAGKRLWLEFDGVYRDAAVFVNGWYLGRHESGYSHFRFDITDVANLGGANVVAVKVDATQAEGWFYEGAGIYRHTWLVKTAPVAIAPDGVFVFSKFKNNVPGKSVEIHAAAEVRNDQTNAVNATVRYEVVAPNGKVVAKGKQAVTVAARAHAEAKAMLNFSKPELWSPETPTLYKLVTSVETAGQSQDRVETEFGIRTVAFDADKGFFLNGKPYVIKGTCNHQDHAGVGAALPDRLQYFRIAKLKEMGSNAYRCTHNPPTPELLEACDRLGMLVMDENRLLGSDAQNLDRLERLVRRDRNHPSVFIWSIANEEFATQTTLAGAQVAATMVALVKQLDPTRPTTKAANVGNTFFGVNSVVDVRGWNYYLGTNRMDAYHHDHPGQPNVGTEQGSTVCTRGIYANDPKRGYVSAYDENFPAWAHRAEVWWSFFAARPWLSGGFVWTGFDYRGEPTPYSWPCINSHFGILDTCGFPKDNFWYYQSWWSDQTVLHLLPHWNWAGKEGQNIDVRALSNCEEVELILNGQSLGRKPIQRNSHARWDVPYAPGTMRAIGYRNGQIVANTKVETTGTAAALQLTPDRATIKADGEDIAIITVAVADALGRIVPTAGNLVQFELQGPGRILGVGNGDPSCHEPDVFLAQWPSRSLPISGWKWKKVADVNKAELSEAAEVFADVDWASHDINSSTGPLGERDKAVFRAKVTVTAADLAAEAVELSLGMVDEDGWVFVNGHKVGESHDWQVSPVFDVKPLLHEGENTIAVAVANYTGAGGLNKGASLRLQQKPIVPQWQRSVFNGLAQIIVQGTPAGGELKLTARAAGLKENTLTITTQPVALRPAVAVK
jgi:beta-galactosidase